MVTKDRDERKMSGDQRKRDYVGGAHVGYGNRSGLDWETQSERPFQSLNFISFLLLVRRVFSFLELVVVSFFFSVTTRACSEARSSSSPLRRQREVVHLHPPRIDTNRPGSPSPSRTSTFVFGLSVDSPAAPSAGLITWSFHPNPGTHSFRS